MITTYLKAWLARHLAVFEPLSLSDTNRTSDTSGTASIANRTSGTGTGTASTADKDHKWLELHYALADMKQWFT